MFTDEYFEQEENAKLMDFFMKYIFTEEVEFEFNKEDNDNVEHVAVPDIAEIADSLKSCFHVRVPGCRKEMRYLGTLIACSKLNCSSTISILFRR
jgi:cell fate regulator YaaT (PSP1 superfamily)